jgi:hypothetical protein
MNLREIQAALQGHILDQDDAIERSVAGDERMSARDRLGIYSYAYIARLVESLGQTYPALVRVMGESRFRETAQAFVKTHPSQFSSIRYYGRELGDDLETGATDTMTSMLSDLARWEWTLAAAFDGPDGAALPVSAISGIAPVDWAGLQFRFHGSLQRVALRTNAVDWWRSAIQGGERPQGACAIPTVEWAAWRHDLTTSFRSLAADEAWAVDAALRGRTFGELCEGLVQYAGEDGAPIRAATFLKIWLTESWVTGFDVAPRLRR